MKRRTLPLALVLALVSIAHAFIGARLHAQTKFGVTSGGASGGGSGTVTSVAATVPTEISLTGSPITTSGTLAFSWANQLQNKIFAAPCSSTGTPTFRVLCAADIPSLDPTKITGTAVITSDARLSDARTPTAHAPTHASVGSDPVTLAESQVTGLTAALAGKQATGNYITSTTGDVVAAGPGAAAATIQPNSVALGTDTTGGYAGSSTEGGSATTADALAANGTNCSAPIFGRGVDAAGNCEGAAIVASDLPSTTVTPGSYTNTSLTVDAQGRITAASNGSGGGVTSVNSLTGALTIAAGTSGTDFAVSPSGSTITLNLPDASATARGVVTTGTQTVAGSKTFSSSPSAPGAGARSERFGASAVLHASATDDTVIGNAATSSAGSGNNTVIGSGATAAGNSNKTVVIGSNSTISNGTTGIIVGSSSTIPSGCTGCVVIGSDAGTVAAEPNVAYIGTGGMPIYFMQLSESGNGYARAVDSFAFRAPGALATGGSSNQGGSSAMFNGGPSSGTAAGGDVHLRTTPSAASGSTRNTYVSRQITVAQGRALTDATAVALFDVALPTLAMAGGIVRFTIRATDGTDMQSVTGAVQFSAVNKGAAYTTDVSTMANLAADDTAVAKWSKSVSAGTITAVWTITTGTNLVTLNVNVDTSLTPSGTNSFVIYYSIENNSEQAITLKP